MGEKGKNLLLNLAQRVLDLYNEVIGIQKTLKIVVKNQIELERRVRKLE